MYASWPCPDGTGGEREEMALVFDGKRDRRLLVLPPLFDEASKFRRQVLEIMMRLDAAGIDSLCPDLPGCNESLAPHEAQSVAGWREAASAAARHFRATHVLGLRAGAWLAPRELPGWLYAAPNPQTVLRTLLRSRTLAAREAGREESGAALLVEGRRDGLVLGGWALGPQLICELEVLGLLPVAGQAPIPADALPGSPLWLRAENACDAAQADALVALIAAGTAA